MNADREKQSIRRRMPATFFPGHSLRVSYNFVSLYLFVRIIPLTTTHYELTTAPAASILLSYAKLAPFLAERVTRLSEAPFHRIWLTRWMPISTAYSRRAVVLLPFPPSIVGEIRKTLRPHSRVGLAWDEELCPSESYKGVRSK